MRKGKVVEVGTSLVRWNNTKKASVAGVLPENTENRKMGEKKTGTHPKTVAAFL